MNYESLEQDVKSTKLTESSKVNDILKELKTLSIEEIQQLMKVSPKIAQLNYDRYQSFDALPSKPALFAYDGDVYRHIDKNNMTHTMFTFAQKHIRIISGLYGLLKPLDRIRAYRLEMSCKLEVLAPQGLAKFWQNDITQNINQALLNHKTQILINIASKEYSAAVNQKLLQFPIVNIHFLEKRNGELKNIAINAKRARGMMASYIIHHKIDNPNDIKDFNLGNYLFDQANSCTQDYYFIKYK